jgi:hypothetical protein
MELFMKFGYFDDAQREYVITQPDTPLPWINYLGCEEYFGLISNTAGGYSFYKDARLRRLTRYRYNNSPLDMGGRYLYMRDNATANTGRRPGCPPASTWMNTSAATDRAIRHHIKIEWDQILDPLFCPARVNRSRSGR